MSKVHTFNTISEYNNFNNHPTLHPLVSVIDFSKAHERVGSKMIFSLYCIFLKEVHCGDLKYGCNYYDYEQGTLVFVAPGQVIDVQNKTDRYQPMGYGLVFHPDLLVGTALGKNIANYNFFRYHTNEALHLSQKEREQILDCLAKIEQELSNPIDRYSKKLITSTVELFLNYCERFYDRQFATRSAVNIGIVEQFEKLLHEYFSSEDHLKENGLPLVSYFAEQISLSTNYFADVIKKETSKSPQEHILNKAIDIAKVYVADTSININEIAYLLGFKYPQHFSRLFTSKVGMTPSNYRKQLTVN